jgi:hypothetical protein
VRDKDRIPRILNKLEEMWENYPDYRLGQLIANLSQEIDNKADPFFLSDDDLEEFIEKNNKPFWGSKDDQ